MFKKYIKEVRRPGQKVNFLLEFLGIEIDYLSEEKAVLALPLRKHFLQGAGVVGGGILATLADEAMGHVVAANLNDPSSRIQSYRRGEFPVAVTCWRQYWSRRRSSGTPGSARR